MKASKNFHNKNVHITWSNNGRYRYEEVVTGYISPKDNYSSIQIMEVIIFKNGTCLIGKDACRLLDMHDYPSYPLQCMKYAEAKETYHVREDLGMKKEIYKKRIVRKEKKYG